MSIVLSWTFLGYSCSANVVFLMHIIADYGEFGWGLVLSQDSLHSNFIVVSLKKNKIKTWPLHCSFLLGKFFSNTVCTFLSECGRKCC